MSLCVDGADLLVADDAFAIDHEAFWNARRAERNLHLALRIAADPLVGIAVAREEVGEVLRAVADGNAVDGDAALLRASGAPSLRSRRARTSWRRH